VIGGTPHLLTDGERRGIELMEVVYEYCCGLDIHKKTVVACIVVPGPANKPVKEIRTFNTMTADLLELADWLTACRVTHVALESTGVVRREVAIN
jgi:transposase